MPTEPVMPLEYSRTIRLKFHPWEHRSTPPYTFVLIEGERILHYATDLDLEDAANMFALVGIPVVFNHVASVSDSLDAAVLGVSHLPPWQDPIWSGIAEGWAAVEASGQLDYFQHAVLEAAAHISGEEILKGMK